MADSAPVMMWMAGTDKLCTHFNKSWLDFTGNSLADEIGEGWVRGVHPEDLKKCLEVYTTAFDARKQFTMEYRLRRFDGQYRWVMDRGVPRFRNDGSFAGYIGCADDITEQRENEALRAELSGRLLRAQEEERARVARELHDDINQKLGLLAVDIQTLQQSAPQTVAEIHAALDDLFKTTNSISADIQHLSHKLHSSRLDYLGLAAALRRLSVEFAEQHGLAIECVITDMPDKLSREIGLCLFRVAQECLTNVAKHSSATRVAVRLQCLEGTIRMSVSDDGNGFNYANVGVRKDPGLGLISMQERLRLVNGDLTIHSEEDMGTQITAVVPLTLEERSAPNTSSKMARKFA
jgi:PAS domain S-box-containing protein